MNKTYVSWSSNSCPAKSLDRPLPGKHPNYYICFGQKQTQIDAATTAELQKEK